MARLYFSQPESRTHSRQYYRNLLAEALAENPAAAETITRQVMIDSMTFWQQAAQIK